MYARYPVVLSSLTAGLLESSRAEARRDSL